MVEKPVDAAEGTFAVPSIFSKIQLAALLVESRIRDSVVLGKHLESVEHDFNRSKRKQSTSKSQEVPWPRSSLRRVCRQQ